MDDILSPSEDADFYFMEQAIAEAEKALSQKEVPIGAVIVYKNRIIGRGYNKCESLQDATAHAEMIAITAASETIGSWRLEDCILYSTLEPCPMCMGAVLNSRIKRVVFACDEPKMGACGSIIDLSEIGYNHSCEITKGVLEEDCVLMLKAFFKELRNRK